MARSGHKLSLWNDGPINRPAIRRRRAGWTMAAIAVFVIVTTFGLVGPWAVLYLSVLFTASAFATVALIVARHAFCRRSFGDAR